jgi:hypothetical protein
MQLHRRHWTRTPNGGTVIELADVFEELAERTKWDGDRV